jgi:hypothetical protein
VIVYIGRVPGAIVAAGGEAFGPPPYRGVSTEKKTRWSATLIAKTVSGGMNSEGYPSPPVIVPAAAAVADGELLAMGDALAALGVVGAVGLALAAT